MNVFKEIQIKFTQWTVAYERRTQGHGSSSIEMSPRKVKNKRLTLDSPKQNSHMLSLWLKAWTRLKMAEFRWSAAHGWWLNVFDVLVNYCYYMNVWRRRYAAMSTLLNFHTCGCVLVGQKIKMISFGPPPHSRRLENKKAKCSWLRLRTYSVSIVLKTATTLSLWRATVWTGAGIGMSSPYRPAWRQWCLPICCTSSVAMLFHYCCLNGDWLEDCVSSSFAYLSRLCCVAWLLLY